MAGFREACVRAGRSPEDVKLVAVSKTYPAEAVAQVFGLGQRLFGENRVQELAEKQPELPKDIEWHFIGRLQRNKVKYIIDKAAMVHSVDSVGLAKEISKQALAKGTEMPALIQVNLGGEETKAGFDRQGLRQGVSDIARLPGIRVLGLMTIGPYFEDPEGARPLFRSMKALMREAAGWDIPGAEMRYLSMGMSHDYTVAIEEGADYVRVGSAIFGQRQSD
jgi:pyridoxal phosphate enzyme (YggS family)